MAKSGFLYNIGNSFRKSFRNFFSISDIDAKIDELLSGRKTHSGVVVNSQTAYHFSAFFDGVRQISQTNATLKLITYKRTSDGLGKERYKAHPAYKLLLKKANKRMVSLIWKEIAQHHCIVHGNSFSYIERDNVTRPIGLIPLNPLMMEVEVTPSGEKVYFLKTKKGEKVQFDDYEILHIPGFGFDGLVGYSVLSLARECIALGVAYEEFSARFIGQGTNLGGFLIHPGKLGVEAKNYLNESIKKKYSGLSNVAKLLILEEGMDYKAAGMPLKDAEFLASRVFTITEIARWLNMPPHKLKELTNATYSNIENEQLTWMLDCMRPWLVRFEACINDKLFDNSDDIFCEYMISDLLRADTKSRQESLKIMRDSGIINGDEWRAMENMNPQPDGTGKIYWQPLNMIDASMAKEMQIESKDDGLTDDDTDDDDDEEAKTEKKEQEKKSFSTYEERIAYYTRKLPEKEQNSILYRRRISTTYKRQLVAGIKKLFELEKKEIQQVINNDLQKRNLETARARMEEIYTRLRQNVSPTLAKIFDNHIEEIFSAAAKDVNFDKKFSEYELNKYKRNYVELKSNNYVEKQKKKILKKITGTKAESKEKIERYLDGMNDAAAKRIASKMLVESECAASEFTYFRANYNVKWVTLGKSCDYCASLNGKVISRSGSFLSKGDTIKSEGKTPIKIFKNLKYPPAHIKCDCAVIATSS